MEMGVRNTYDAYRQCLGWIVRFRTCPQAEEKESKVSKEKGDGARHF